MHLGPTEGTGLPETMGITPLDIAVGAGIFALAYYGAKAIHRTLTGKTH